MNWLKYVLVVAVLGCWVWLYVQMNKLDFAVLCIFCALVLALFEQE